MPKIAVSFVIDAQDAYDDKILELVKAIKAAGGEVTGARAQPVPPQQAFGIPAGTPANAPTPPGKTPINMRTGQPVAQ